MCVVTPTPLLMVEIEPAPAGAAFPRADLHLHPGGQGLWVASMCQTLGAEVHVCGPFGGETGAVLLRLLGDGGIQVAEAPYARGNGGEVVDRRGGERHVIASMRPHTLSRHEVDDLYGRALVTAIDSEVCVLTGSNPPGVLPDAFFTRLVKDVRSTGTAVVADLSGAQALAAAEAGPEVLKISDEELGEAGLAPGTARADLVAAALTLTSAGVGTVVVSRGGQPALVVGREGVHEAAPPPLSVLEHRGAGDSMTAGIAVALARGAGIPAAVRLGTAAGALNVTRRGLGTGRRDTIERLARTVEWTGLSSPGEASPTTTRSTST